MKKHLFFYTIFIITIVILSMSCLSQKNLIDNKDYLLSIRKLSMEFLNKDIVCLKKIIECRDAEIIKIKDNYEIMTALKPLEDLLSEDEIDELIKDIPHGSFFRVPFQITAGFGESIGFHGVPRTKHRGIDAIPKNADSADWTITPVGSGVVEDIGISDVYGKHITIRHSENIRTFYAHLETIYYSAEVGSIVTPDTKIGLMGNTGMTSSDSEFGDGSHLHAEYQVWVGDRWVSINPLPFLERE